MSGPVAPTRSRVLLVEDEVSVREVLSRALGAYDVIETEDAEGALDLMTAAPVDLVITDIALPRMDGCALAAHLRERWPEVPVLAISGYVEGRDVDEFAFDGFFTKPLPLAELRAMVGALLTRSAG